MNLTRNATAIGAASPLTRAVFDGLEASLAEAAV
jgi:hypothetical protein